MSKYRLPDWADPRLIVDVDGAQSGGAVISANPHTFRGLLGLYDLADEISFSAKTGAVSPTTDYGAGWLAGYIEGNEPEPDVNDLLPRGRRQRELAYFREYSSVLPIDRSGVITFSAKSVIARVPESEGRLSTVADLVGAAMANLEQVSRWWKSASWLPITDDGADLDAMPFRDADEIESAFRWLNPPYALNSIDSPGPLVRLVCADPAGVVELVVSVDSVARDVDMSLSFVVNIEGFAPFGIDQSVGAEGQIEEWMRQSLLSMASGIHADVASVSFGAPLIEARGLGVAVGEYESWISAVPGWMTVLGESILNESIRTADIEGFSREECVQGLIFEFSGGSANLSVRAVDRVSDLIDSEVQ